ncbi:MAG: DUF1178 family protein [Deltaproteobacteria bacterium]|nr:DUF1178 family protein [Deltaproteobacteria bacterium]MBW1911211.1 DUF1178 family protein [Deltaproteobacteria bacterium]MBW2033379.1 DUF1178 family protein [Deltaproteobacteria bacterium]MBW2115237.1 DUF1178 family protein [Deltaproteobacteria bacterium]MBW2168518.1 DUF1178 family protein [Deltaproteobacteria bacterium]
MIVFDLECSQGHVFEGWFDSLESFEQQNVKNLVCCPYCDDANIRRLMSPVAIKRSHPDIRKPLDPIDYQRLAREVVNYIQDNFEDVGSKFAGEALKIHYGVSEKRNIRGSATSEEEKSLKEEGIEFFKVPVPKIDDDADKKN